MSLENEIDELEKSTEEFLKEHPTVSPDDDFETRLNKIEEQNTAFYKEKLAELEQTPEERAATFERLKKPSEPSFLIGDPISWSLISEEANKKAWIWENYVAKGYITLLSALWKAGKSTLLRALFVAMQSGEEFAGQPTYPSRVLVISEEAAGEWADKKESLDPVVTDPILVWARPIRVKPSVKQWGEFLAEVAQRCKDEKIDLVVIDTLSTFWSLDNENDSTQMMRALIPLYHFTENDIAVLLVHHFRKGGGDQAQASRGSGALTGFVDNIIEFTRKDDGALTQRVLKAYGRFEDVIPAVVIELQPDGKYKTLGLPSEVSKSARLGRVIEIFQESGTPLSTTDVFNLWVARDAVMTATSSITLRSIQRYITDMAEKHILVIEEERLVGRKKIPFYVLKGTAEQIALAIPSASLESSPARLTDFDPNI